MIHQSCSRFLFESSSVSSKVSLTSTISVTLRFRFGIMVTSFQLMLILAHEIWYDGYIFGSLPRPPESYSYFGSSAYAVCSWILPFLIMNLASRVIFVDSGIIFVCDNAVLREGSFS
ncbi:hypothetical protein ISN45_Aa07g009920 [Arabidopsis thaliana x Arabidopsis arenosa]|uniref:Transmembrane protein n=1 Tax=Arabidopsis thaliana x Arabidopsis arenosa TaxID=1240361 RepID=A0A8T1Y1E4_9BRAS|nr:hypothetical protein ISN45_Aa07g009920 [Arabidopsis thaliana x Arabidopsis arenosa]